MCHKIKFKFYFIATARKKALVMRSRCTLLLNASSVLFKQWSKEEVLQLKSGRQLI